MSLQKITLPGIVLSSEEAKGIAKGIRTQIIKSEQYLKYIGKLIFVVCDEKAYATIKMGTPKVKSLSQFNKDFKKHKISVEERKLKWPRKKKLFAYDVDLVENFDIPLSVDIDGNTRLFIKNVTLTIEEDKEEEILQENVEEETQEQEDIQEEECGTSVTVINRDIQPEPVSSADVFEEKFIERRGAVTDFDVRDPNARKLDDYLDEISADEVMDVITEQKGFNDNRNSSRREVQREDPIPQRPPKSGNKLKDQITRMRDGAKDKTQHREEIKQTKNVLPQKKNRLSSFSEQFKKKLERL